MQFDPYDPAFFERDWAVDVDGQVRFAVIGLGGFGRNKALPAIDAAEHAKATTLVSGSPEKARRVAESTATVEETLTYEEFHNGEAAASYDAVYVVTPNYLHLDAVETAAELGKDVLCEKPLEGSTDRAEQLVTACENADVKLMTAYRMHFEPITRRIREAIDAGFIGSPIQLSGAFCGNKFAGDHDQWRLDPDLAGGGPLYDLGIYPINTARFLLNQDPIAATATVVRNEPVMDGLDVHVTAQLDFPDEVTATCRTSYNSGGETFMSILGTEGRIELDSAFNCNASRTLTVERDGIELQTTIQTTEVHELFEYFSTRVLGDHSIEPDGPHGLEDMRIMDAIYESAETGRRIDC